MVNPSWVSCGNTGASAATALFASFAPGFWAAAVTAREANEMQAVATASASLKFFIVCLAMLRARRKLCAIESGATIIRVLRGA